ncbi:MAG: hypothetical protein OHK0012_23380 [Synechococcales cyanobacterium]
MNETDWLTRTRWIMYGAASSLVESLQDSQKAQENWQKLSNLDALTAELVAKGEITEAEARRYVEQMLAAKSEGTPPATTPTPSASAPTVIEIVEEPTAPPPTGDPVNADDIADLMDLTRQIESLRLDLERQRLDSDA